MGGNEIEGIGESLKLAVGDVNPAEAAITHDHGRPAAGGTGDGLAAEVEVHVRGTDDDAIGLRGIEGAGKEIAAGLVNEACAGGSGIAGKQQDIDGLDRLGGEIQIVVAGAAKNGASAVAENRVVLDDAGGGRGPDADAVGLHGVAGDVAVRPQGKQFDPKASSPEPPQLLTWLPVTMVPWRNSRPLPVQFETDESRIWQAGFVRMPAPVPAVTREFLMMLPEPSLRRPVPQANASQFSIRPPSRTCRPVTPHETARTPMRRTAVAPVAAEIPFLFERTTPLVMLAPSAAAVMKMASPEPEPVI